MTAEAPLSHDDRRPFGVHLTNIAGTGAVQLVGSLLPALERAHGYCVDRMHLPDRGALARYRRVTPGVPPRVYTRRLPNALSRALECLLFARRFDASMPLLVLGDLPLRCASRQTVFIQTPHLMQGDRSGSRVAALKYRIARAVFRAGMASPAAYIVQSDVMRAALVETYPTLEGKVHVVPQPVPAWLLEAGLCRSGRLGPREAPLRLFYPAAPYPHKNHRLLAGLPDAAGWPVERLTLTVPTAAHPDPRIGWIKCVGLLSPQEVIAHYAEADALLFLSSAESYGLPLVEAMWIGLPIVCPDLPYARSLCGAQGCYFDPADPASLRRALTELRARLTAGWWPDWADRLAPIPKDWNAVAEAMLRVTFDADSSPPVLPSSPGSS
jgi:hypothetical protein